MVPEAPDIPSRLQPGADIPAAFDEYADTYDAALEQAISVSGESKDYFARSRVQWTARRLGDGADAVHEILDFGCGTGTAAPHLQEAFPDSRVLGVDVSARSLDTARRLFASGRADFAPADERIARGERDLAYCNGVFHHIPVAQRHASAKLVYDSLRSGGFLALWENSPWSLATRYVMSRCEFDRDAVTLTPPEARQMLRYAGFQIVRTDFLFIFPRSLRFLRPLEPLLSSLPLGTQYLILARKPG